MTQLPGCSRWHPKHTSVSKPPLSSDLYDSLGKANWGQSMEQTETGLESVHELKGKLHCNRNKILITTPNYKEE